MEEVLFFSILLVGRLCFIIKISLGFCFVSFIFRVVRFF